MVEMRLLECVGQCGRGWMAQFLVCDRRRRSGYIYMNAEKKRYPLGSVLGVVGRGFTSGRGCSAELYLMGGRVVDAAEAFEASVTVAKVGVEAL